MDIRIHKHRLSKLKLLLRVYLILILVTASGCAQTLDGYTVGLCTKLESTIMDEPACDLLPYHVADDESNENEDADEERICFFGLWKLAVLVTQEYKPDTLTPPNPYVIHYDIGDFLGYELEVREDFVRLGYRVLNEPLFDVRNISTYLSLGNRPNREIRIFSGSMNYYDIANWIDSFTGLLSLTSVSVTYPLYGSLWWRSEIMDPWDVVYGIGMFAQNPLMHHFWLLDDNTLLFSGRFGNSIFATRINSETVDYD